MKPMPSSPVGHLKMPTRLEWTPRLISQFWDGVGQSPFLDGMSFARMNGPILMQLMGPWIAAGARCLDYGGGGHLLRLMISAGYPIAIFEPTSEALAFFGPRMVPGGLIVCDDYGFETCPGARRAMDEHADAAGQTIVHLPTGQGVIFAGR
jgi:hypothetical protein